MQSIEYISVDKVFPHEKNPRLVVRQDVVNSIISQLQNNKEFDPAHALLVRPIDGGYQILSGHHRYQAAIDIGLSEIPCWVRELSDEESYMQLVLSNMQGELSPLEMGIHVLGAVELSDGGKGNKGGLSEYSELVGKSPQHISRLRKAAEVFESVKGSPQGEGLLDKSKHLYEISKAPREVWELLVDELIDLSVEDVKYWVSIVRDFNISEKWKDIFLPYIEVISHFIATKEFSPTTVSKLISAVELVEDLIGFYEIDVDTHMDTFYTWLRANQAGLAWDIREIHRYRRELENVLEHISIKAENRWNFGSWETFVADLKDDSIAVLLSDPPYGMSFQSDYKLDRREKRNHSVLHNDGDNAKKDLEHMLATMYPKLKENSHVFIFTNWKVENDTRQALHNAGYIVRGSLIWAKNNTGMGDVNTTFAPRHERIIHAVKGSPILFERQSDVLEYDRVPSVLHPTEKPVDLLKRLIEITSVEGEIIADPFAGVASTLVAAQELNREFWGCEIEAKYYDIGWQRITGTL
jgi:site-specific DNA-methyltransferase (adenine-specific)